MRTVTKTIITLAIILSLFAMPFIANDSDADSKYISCEGLTVTSFDDATNMSAGGSSTVSLTLRNDSTGDITVKLTSSKSAGNPVVISFDANDFTLAKGKTKMVNVTYSCDRMCDHGTFESNIIVTVYNYSTNSSGSEQMTIKNTVNSQYISDESFNKIMCKFPNTLPEPFNGPTTSAVITGIIWLAIAFVVYILTHAVCARVFKGENDEIKSVSKNTGLMLVLLIVLYGLIQSLTVYGADEQIIITLNDITSFTNIIMLAYIAWNVYTNFIKHLFHTMEKDGKIEGADTSLIPLFNMVGKIIITIVAVASILATVGFDLMALLAGAGIAGLAISIGAQNLLSQFFGGLVLLILRPFKIGDMVKIDNSKNIYEVKKVGLMTSTFKNWENLEIITMPNDKVSNAMITNITEDTKAYRIFLYYNVDFESDFDKVREILVDVASRHPKVITDGSYSKPDVRVNQFCDTAVEVRLAVYITDFRDNIVVSDELYMTGIKELQEKGVNIPYEKRDVVLVYPD